MSDAPGGMGEATLAGMRTEATLVARRGFMHDGDEYDVIAAVVTPYEDAIRRLSAALDEQQRENERQADLIDEFRKRNESQDRIRKRLISERDALQVDNSVQFDRAERAEAALADLRAKVDGALIEIEGEKVSRTLTDFTEGVNEGLEIAAENLRAALAAAPSGEPNTKENR